METMQNELQPKHAAGITRGEHLFTPVHHPQEQFSIPDFSPQESQLLLLLLLPNTSPNDRLLT